jgi:hypothetical protein
MKSRVALFGIATVAALILWKASESPAPETPVETPEVSDDSPGVSSTLAPTPTRAVPVPLATVAEPQEPAARLPNPRVICRHESTNKGTFAKETFDECIGEMLQTRFQSEVRDPSWASQTERTFVDGLAQINDVTAVTSMTMECRLTTCRLQMGFPTMGDVPTRGPPERDRALVRNIFLPILQQAGLQDLIVPYPRVDDVPQRTYYFYRY